MGTTIVVAALHDDRIAIAYVGDSRLYRLRHGALEQITRDHSLLEEMIARGHYSREDAQRLVRKNIVTRALGVENEVQVDVIEDTVEVDDRSEEHTSELQSLMRISYAVFCLKKK